MDKHNDLDKGATTLQKLGIRIGRSPDRGHEAPKIKGRSANRGRSLKKVGEGSERELSEPLSRKFLEFQTSNCSIWCIVEREILTLTKNIF